MIYRAIGVTSGGHPASLDIAFTEFTATAGSWQFEIIAAEQMIYDNGWQQRLQQAASLSVREYQLLHLQYGTFIGQQVNAFIEKYALQHKVQLLICDGHNIFNAPEEKLVVQLGSGAAIATATQLAVITELRTMDCLLGGNCNNVFSRAQSLLFPGREADNIEVGQPFEEAVLAALAGVLRWREEATTAIEITGAAAPSIGGAVWLGNEA